MIAYLFGALFTWGVLMVIDSDIPDTWQKVLKEVIGILIWPVSLGIIFALGFLEEK